MAALGVRPGFKPAPKPAVKPVPAPGQKLVTNFAAASRQREPNRNGVTSGIVRRRENQGSAVDPANVCFRDSMSAPPRAVPIEVLIVPQAPTTTPSEGCDQVLTPGESLARAMVLRQSIVLEVEMRDRIRAHTTSVIECVDFHTIS